MSVAVGGGPSPPYVRASAAPCRHASVPLTSIPITPPYVRASAAPCLHASVPLTSIPITSVPLTAIPPYVMLFYRLREALVYWEAHRYKKVFADDANGTGAKRFHVLDLAQEREECFAVSWSPMGACGIGRQGPRRVTPSTCEGLLTAPPVRQFASFYEAIHTDFVYLVFDLDMSARRASSSVYLESSAFLPRHVIERCRIALDDIVGNGFEHVVPLQALRLRTLSLLSKGLRAMIPPEYGAGETLISGLLDATRPAGEKPKFSLHVHTKLGIFQHFCDGAAIAAAVNLRCIFDLWKVILLPDADIVDVVLFALVWPWTSLPTRLEEVAQRAHFIDVSIYSRNRVMRMYGQSKFGESRPLREVDLANGALLDLPSNSAEMWERWSSKYRIMIHEAGTGIISVLSSSIPAHFGMRPSVSRALACRETVIIGSAGTIGGVCVNMLRPVESFDDLFILEFASQHGLCLEPSPSTSASARKAVNPNVPVPRSAVSGKSGDFTILLSDSTLFNDRGEAISVDEICAGDILHCPKCDVVRSSGITAPDLNPSMRAFSPSTHEVMLYCFACNVLHIVRNVVDYTGFKEDAFIVENETGYLTADIVLGDIAVDNDIFSDCAGSAQNRGKNRWLVAVNSPMGSGKTEAVSEFAKRRLSNGPFLVVTYRRALARQLAERFNAACYLDVLENEGCVDEEKLVICTNSMGRMSTGSSAAKYALVVIDEAGFVRRHYVQGTFHNSRDRMSSYKVLQHKLQQASLVIIMQDALSNSDVSFYRSMGNFPADRIRRVYMPRRPLSDILKSTVSESLWMTALKKCISAGNKVFICCSMRSDAEVLHNSIVDSAFFKSGNYSSEEWRERVALITGTSTFPKGKIDNVDEFALKYKEFDVAIATSVLETGVSLSGHYTHVFGHFKRTPITHATQAQLASRVRNAERVFLLLERGQQLLFTTKVKEIARLLKLDLASLEEAIFNDTVADIMAEFADTFNNNDSLWKEIRHSVSVDDDNGSFNSRLRSAGFLNSDSDKETPEDEQELRKSIMDVRQCGTKSVRRFFLANMTEKDLDQHDVQGMVEDDLIAAASASEKLARHEFIIGKKGTSLYLCLRRVAGNTGISRSQGMGDFIVPAHIERLNRHVFMYMALVDFTCTNALRSHDYLALQETAYWTHLENMDRSNTAVGRRLQFSLSEVKFASRLVEAIWGSIWPAAGTVHVPTETALAKVFDVFENDSRFVSDERNKEVQWAALGRKNPKTVLSSIRRMDPSKRMQAFTRCVRDKSPIQTMSVKREVAGIRMNGSAVKDACVNGLAIVMAEYNPSAIGLSKTSTVTWSFFKEPVEAVRACIAKFEVNEDALKNSRTRTKPLLNQIGETLGYDDEDRRKDIESITTCGFFDACVRLQQKLEEAADLLERHSP
jgi:late competence protein required for DNA uptake (superfamily II DNA/RNA helicase)